MRAWPWMLCAALVVAARTIVADAQLDWDEELYWQIAQAWRAGDAPYADIFDHKAPLLYLLQLVYSGFSGHLWAVRVVATLLLAISAGCFGRAMWPRRADLGAAFAFLVLLTLSSFGSIGANSEILYAPYVLFTGAALLRARLFAAALAAAVAVNVKYTVGLDILGVAAFLFIGERLTAAQARRFLVMAAGAAGAMWLALYAYFRARGVDLIETTVVVNLAHAAGERRPLAEALGSYAVTRFAIAVAALTLWAVLSGNRVERRIRMGASAWAAASLLQALITGKTYFHYFTPVFIPFCVLLVAHWESPMATWRRRSSLMLGAVLALLLLGDGIERHQQYSITEARLADDICPRLRGRSVYVADELLSIYRVCGLPPSKYMFPPFILRPHFVALAGSRGRSELQKFDLIVLSPGSRFESAVREVRDEGVLEL